MRILYFSRDYTPHDHRFLAALAESGHQAYFLRLERQENVLEQRPLPKDVELVACLGGEAPVPRGKYPQMLKNLKVLLEKLQPDLVHAGPIQSAAYLAAQSGFHPLVSMSWGSDMLMESERSQEMKRATQVALNGSDILLCDCQAVKEKAINTFSFPEERIIIFPWGIDLNIFSPNSPESVKSGKDLRGNLGWENNFVLLSLRTWEPVYGVDVVARGFLRAVQENPSLRLLLLGDGSQSGKIRQILNDPLVKDKVHCAGKVGNHELPAYFHAADLYISASHSDGSSVSLMEALASGLPVVVSDIPGNREWVTMGKEGWHFTDGSAEELAERVISAQRSKVDLAEMGKAARQLAEQQADWKKNRQQLLRAYDMAVSL